MLDKKNLNQIWKIYSVGAVAYVALIVIAFLKMNQSGFSIITNYWTSNDLASQTNTVFAPASSTLWMIQYRYFLFVFLILSLVVPCIYIYMIRNNKKQIDLHVLRRLDWAVTGALMVVFLSLFSSLQDLMTLILIIGLFVIGSVLFWIATNQQNLDKVMHKKLMILGLVSIILPWLLIIFYMSGTLVYSGIRAPWFIYALYLVGIINTAVIIYGPFWHQNRINREKELTTEAYPIIINQLIKVAFCIILIVGLSK